MKKIENENGSAIITVIIFITIVTFFLSLIFLYNKYQYKLVNNLGNQIQAYYNAKSAAFLALQKFKEEKQMTSASYFFQLTKKDSSKVKIKPFGLFLLVEAVSKLPGVTYTRRFLAGQTSDSRFNAALVIGDINNPIVISGNTIIQGDVFCGPQGIKSGILRGKRFNKDKMVFGSILKYNYSHLPNFNPGILNTQIKRLQERLTNIQSIPALSDSVIKLNNIIIELNKDKFNSLISDGLKKILGPGTIYLSDNITFYNIYFEGPLIIYSGQNINFSRQFKAKKILVNAKKITISSFQKINGQFIAQDTLIIAKGVTLTYPSIAAVFASEMNIAPTLIKISDAANVKGTVILSSKIHNNIKNNQLSRLIIEKNAIIDGVTFSDNYTELHGLINGIVLTDQFYFYLSPTLYINWINDAFINRRDLNKKLILPLGFDLDTDYAIIKEF